MWTRQIPNIITGVRFLLVPPMMWLLFEGRFGMALGVFALMGLSDALDGFLAKTYDWRTRLGEYIDPLADTTMLMGSYITLGILGLLPLWLVTIVIVRDVVIMTGAIAYHFLTHQLTMAPSIISKVNTASQIILVLFVILAQLMSLPDMLIQALIVVTLFTTVASGVAYVIEWSTRAIRSTQSRGN